MNITIIGSTAYKERMIAYKWQLEKEFHTVRMPAFDDHMNLDEIGVCKYNLEAIKWADRVDIIWDARSTGFIFDFGMCFALDKPMKIIYLNTKTFQNLLVKYAEA